jgi:hypothetical protein
MEAQLVTVLLVNEDSVLEALRAPLLEVPAPIGAAQQNRLRVRCPDWTPLSTVHTGQSRASLGPAARPMPRERVRFAL